MQRVDRRPERVSAGRCEAPQRDWRDNVRSSWSVDASQDLKLITDRHFTIADFYVIGYLDLPELELTDEPAKTPEDHDSEDTPSPDEGPSQHKSQTSIQSTEPAQSVDAEEDNGPETVIAPITKQRSTLDKDLAVPRDPEWVRRASVEHHQRCHLRVEPHESQRCPPKDDQSFWKFCEEKPLSDHGEPCESVSHNALLAIMGGEPLKPFRDPPRIMPLASVTGRNKSRNKDVDILAVIVSIDESTTKPARLSMKRDIRVQDPSVDQPIVVGIFTDPLNFRSSVGTIALFRHVTTHDWKQGNLNAYPARVGGRDWFIPNPYCLGLRDDIHHVEEWWQKQPNRSHTADAVPSKHATRNDMQLKGCRP